MSDNNVSKQNGNLPVFLPLLILTFSIWIIKFYWDRRTFFKKIAAIPKANTGPFSFAGDFYGKTIDECLQKVVQYFQTSPDVFRGWLGHLFLVGVSKPEHLETVLTNSSSLGKSSLFNFTKPYMGEGLFSAKVDIWKKNRKLINPTFSQKVLNSFIPIFQEKTDILIGILEKQVGQPNIDIANLMSGCTLDTICESVMGLRVEAQTTSNPYGKLLDRIMEIITQRIFNVIHHPNIIFYRTKIGKEFNKVVTELNGFSQKVIKQRRAIFEQKKKETNYVGEEGGIKTSLELLLEIYQNGDHFTDQQLQDEVNTFISAGSDTTAITMSFCFLTMGLFPKYQQKLYEEAMEVLGADRYATKEDIPKLKFTEMFIKETLRIFPIAPLLIRMASDDIKLDDLIIPKHAVIIMGIINLHRNPKYWDDPLEFNPYRFLPEEWAKKHPFSHLPFSGGPRNCIGRGYAMLIMKLILSKIVRHFIVKTDYKSVEEVELKLNLMMRPSKGFKVSLEARDPMIHEM